jgi:CheY-specific phosphatase CheX
VTEAPLRAALAESLDDVLEKMFFVRSLDGAQSQPGEQVLTAYLAFEGDPSGSLTLRVSAAAARSVAADFLGAEEQELSGREISEVICELANMICGSMLSRVESNQLFRLGPPQIVPGDTAPAVPPTATTYSAGVGSGAITVIFNMETQACATTEKRES